MSEENCAGTAIIFMTARNCEMYAQASLLSLARQTYDRLHVLYVDDCSDDTTGAIAERLLAILFPGRHTFIRNETRFGKARNAWEHLRPLAGQAEFIAVLDGDDQLIEPEILTLMAKYYTIGRDVVWTNYVTERGAVGGNAALDPEKSPRMQGWKSSHFFSFRAELLATVPEDYFKNRAGEWFPAACDIALAMPILDQTRRYEFIPVNAYRYTAFNPYSHHNLDQNAQGLNSTIQRTCAAEIAAKPPLPLLRPLERQIEAAPAAIAADTRIAVAPRHDIWADKAADHLSTACPALLNAHGVLNENTLAPMEVWGLFQMVSRIAKGRVLHVGTPASALYLAAIVACLPDTSLCCLTGSEAEWDDLDTKLAASGLAARVDIISSSMAMIQLDGQEGPFASTEPLNGQGLFQTVIVDARGRADETDMLLVALPALAALLEPSGFRLAMFASQAASLQSVAALWKSKTTGMKFCLNGIGGSGLAVIGGR